MEKIKPADLQFTFTTELFFDTNVWLLLYGNIADYQEKDQKAYSALLEQTLTRNISIFITSTVISEFANVLLRFDFKNWKSIAGKPGADFKKDYVGKESYNKMVETITSLIKKILSLPNVIKAPDDFHSLNMDAILKRFMVVDFNDSMIFQFVTNKDLVLVTNDGDFQKIEENFRLVTTQ